MAINATFNDGLRPRFFFSVQFLCRGKDPTPIPLYRSGPPLTPALHGKAALFSDVCLCAAPCWRDVELVDEAQHLSELVCAVREELAAHVGAEAVPDEGGEVVGCLQNAHLYHLVILGPFPVDRAGAR